MTAVRPAIDLLDTAAFAGSQPHDQFRWLREHEPVHRHADPHGPDFWVVTRHADVIAVEEDYETFSSEPTIMIPDPSEELGMGDHKMMISADPPLHTSYRRLVHKEFTPKAAQALSVRIGELATTIVDRVAERGECDLVADIAGELPSYVIAELLGIPLEDGRRLYHLTELIHADPTKVPENAGTNAVLEMFGYASKVAAEKRATPGEDLASRLLHAEVDGHQLDDMDFCLFFLLLVDAGGDTTRNLVAGGMQALFEHPEERRRLQADLDGLLQPAMDEMLRFVSPVIYMRRTATRDTVLGGQQIKAGEKVVVYYGSANRDAEVFDDPETFRIDRTPNPHIAFGVGRHFCLGVHIARVEIAAMLREILTRLPDIEPSGPPTWQDSSFIFGPRTMPVRFTPSRVS